MDFIYLLCRASVPLNRRCFAALIPRLRILSKVGFLGHIEEEALFVQPALAQQPPFHID